jgi:hypothetical protein
MLWLEVARDYFPCVRSPQWLGPVGLVLARMAESIYSALIAA